MHSDKLLPDCERKIYKYEMVFVIQVVFAAFVDNAHQVIFRRNRIGKKPIDLARYKRCSIISVIDA